MTYRNALKDFEVKYGGEDSSIPCETEHEILDAVFAVDQSYLLAYREGEMGWVFLVCGNEEAIISDYGRQCIFPTMEMFCSKLEQNLLDATL